MTFDFAVAEPGYSDPLALGQHFHQERPRVVAPQSRPVGGSSDNIVIFEQMSRNKIDAIIFNNSLFMTYYYQTTLPNMKHDVDIVDLYTKRLRLYTKTHWNAPIKSAHDSVQQQERTKLARAKALPLDTRFTPSSRLLSIWISSLEAYAEEALQDQGISRLVTRRSDVQSLSSEFSSILYSSIAQYAAVKSYTNSVLNISFGGRFIGTLQNKILSDLSVLPDEGTDFFRLLTAELASFLSEGSRFVGGWGELRLLNGGDFQLASTRIKVRKPKGFLASDED